MRILNMLGVMSFFYALTTFAITKESSSMSQLTNHRQLPDFSKINPKDFDPAITSGIASLQGAVDDVVKEKNPTWASSLQKIDEEGTKLDFASHIISQLNSVQNTEEVRKAFEVIIPKLSNFGTDLSQNKELYELYKKLKSGAEYKTFSDAQKTIVNHAIRDFKVAGIDLDDAKKARIKEINLKLSELGNKFGNNLVDAVQTWSLHITKDQKDKLKGIPENTLELAAAKAKKDGKEGWVLTLDEPCYAAVMAYAEDRAMRAAMYKGYGTKASAEAEAKQFDNTGIIDETMALRHERAKIVDLKNYAELSLVAKMASSTDEVMKFLEDLAHRAKPQAEKELAALKAFAKERDGIEDFSSWDAGYYSNLYKKTHFNFSQEELRPYFPQEKVFLGMFALVERLYGLKISEVKNVSTWDKEVKFYEIRDKSGVLRGSFYSDLYARDLKNGGAWSGGIRDRIKFADGYIETPLAVLAANFRPASGGKPALLSHDEIVTLFHEFGHTLHRLLTKVDHPSVGGTHIAWDAVELPSQFMEHFAYEWEVVEGLSGHYETGKPLPKAEFDKIMEVKNYNSALALLRQMEFAIFDFRMHMNLTSDTKKSVQQILDEVRDEVAVIKPPSYNRFQNSFHHIFSDSSYAAGYYSYSWAEVLSSDAFAKFEEDGIWNEATGISFLENILEPGGSREPMDLFVAFRGRKPSVDALLRHRGIKG